MQTNKGLDRTASRGHRLPQIMKLANCFTIIGSVMVLLTSGCATMNPPKWNPPVAFQSGEIDLKGKKIVVSDFLQGEHAISVTQSQQIKEILESAQVQDISLLIANQLNQAGVPARAARSFGSPLQLQHNELLLRGGLTIGKRGTVFSGSDERQDMSGSEYGAFALFCGSLCMFGAFLPEPFPMYGGADVTYHLELLDPSGNILLQTGDLRSEVLLKEYFMIWGLLGDKSVETVKNMMPKVLVEAFLKNCNQKTARQ